MDDTWNYDLMDLLRQAQAGQPASLTDFVRLFTPLAATNADHSALLVLRRFDAAPSQDKRRVLNCRPGGLDSQPGITIATYSGTGGAQSNSYLPTDFAYTGLCLRGQEVDIVRADAPTLTTNINELHRKLNFWLTFAEDDLRAAFGHLCNEHYAPREPAAPAPNELVVELPSVGQLTYNPRYERYEGSFPIDEQPVALTLVYVATPQRAPLLAWAERQLRAGFWEPMLEAMTDKMLALKNDDWLDDDAGELELSKEEFQRRISIYSIAFHADGSVTIYCDDDELFFGHTIVVEVSKKGKYRTANLAG